MLRFRGLVFLLQYLLFHELPKVRGVEFPISRPMRSHVRHAHEVADIIKGALPVSLIEKLSLPKNHLYVIQPKLPIPPLLLVFL